jgi:hypothetical protein
MIEPPTLSVPVGESAQDYSGGDLLNAINSVVCYFQQTREQTDAQIADALRLYADGLGVVS